MKLSPREQTNKLLLRAKEVLLVAPQKMNADIASAFLSLNGVLTQAGKSVTIVSDGEIPSQLSFLESGVVIQKSLKKNDDFVLSLSTDFTQVETVKHVFKDNSVDIVVTPKQGNFQPSDVSFPQNTTQFDLILVLGADNLEDVGTVFENNTKLFASTTVVNISVSGANEFFGNINVVDTSRSAVCEIVFEILVHDSSLMKFVEKQTATELLTGIIAQTDSFLDPITTATSLEIASQLQSLGADQSSIIEHIFKKKSLKTLKIWGRILGNLELDMVHRIAWSQLNKSDFELGEATYRDIGDMTDVLLRHTKGSELVALFIEQKKKSIIQIRSSNENIDFSDIQNFLGGGGELMPHGIDFEIEKKSLAEIQYPILKLLVHFQKQKLHIPEDVEIQKTDIFDSLKHSSQSSPKTEQKPIPTQILPETIPFEVPSNSKISHRHIPEENTQSTNTTLDDFHIPDWLKKS
jgi:phosphoesterase RecJ-like protein